MRILLLLVLALTSLVPSWSATADPVIGTRTVTPKVTTVFTAGSVPFVSTNGVLYQDNAKFFWDDTNFRLGVAKTSPSYTLDVAGTGFFTGLLNTTTAGILTYDLQLTGLRYLGWTNATQLRSISDGNFRLEMQDGTSILTTTIVAGGDTTLQPTGQYLKLGHSSCVYVDKTNVRLGVGVVPTSTFTLPTTIIAGGTTGNQTINKATGSVNIAAGGSSITVTNSTVAADSIVLAIPATNDATALVKNVVASSGQFTVTMNAAVTAETKIKFIVVN